VKPQLLTIIAVALRAIHAGDARTHRRAAKSATPMAATKPDAKIPTETKRDPADITLDRKIKSICAGC
jgi:hypothetical protein